MITCEKKKGIGYSPKGLLDVVNLIIGILGWMAGMFRPKNVSHRNVDKLPRGSP